MFGGEIVNKRSCLPHHLRAHVSAGWRTAAVWRIFLLFLPWKRNDQFRIIFYIRTDCLGHIFLHIINHVPSDNLVQLWVTYCHDCRVCAASKFWLARIPTSCNKLMEKAQPFHHPHPVCHHPFCSGVTSSTPLLLRSDFQHTPSAQEWLPAHPVSH
jgi:predicted membrane channel-forming protein YqfA (hemolysin III family)